MLLTGILKDTPNTHPDFPSLTSAVKLVKEITDFVNDSIKSNQKVLQFTQLLGILGLFCFVCLYVGYEKK
jgi:hypothetical protein